jgi:hypothetical protein
MIAATSAPSRPVAPAAALLVRELQLLGFTEGAPPHIAAEVVAADVRIYSRLTCGSCRGRGMKVTAYHRGRAYRLLASCRKCGAGENC